ncbi:MAG: lyase family protein, partial [Candidatus Bathyarchaeia archaeon]
ANSVAAVTARYFLLEVMAELTILAVDVTRFVEDLEIWSTMEFGIVELPDGFASTSSIMPQKKNPDILEVIRARISLVLGNYTGSATVLMSLPSTYNMDFQEITPKLWQSIDTVDDCLSMLAKIVSNLIIKSIALDKHSLSFLSATELANLLVRNYEIPFRTSHRIVGIIVKRLLEDGKSFRDLTVELVSEVAKQVLGHYIPLKAKEISNIMDLSRIVESYNVKGGPAPEEVKRMMKARFETISKTETWISEKKNKLSMAYRRLENCITEILSSC